MKHSKRYTLFFVTFLSTICALILSILSIVLKKPQEEAKELFRSTQLLVAAKILSHEGYFQLEQDKKFIPAAYDPDKKMLIPYEGTEPPAASGSTIMEIYNNRVHPKLTDSKGNVYTFQEKGVDYNEYLIENQKQGYSQLDLKLVYEISGNNPTIPSVYGYVIPINGFGLWDAIYGFLALFPDANHILGITFYEQSETPGLGAEISEPWWQEQFYNKVIFRKNSDGTTQFSITKLGIQVVKTTVENELGQKPASQSAVDGISGASVTSLGVSNALHKSLTPYREFLINEHKRASLN